MTEPNPSRPVPAPPRSQVVPAPEQDDDSRRPFDDLERRPVAEHVAVFEAEHARLRDELSTIDRL